MRKSMIAAGLTLAVLLMDEINPYYLKFHGVKE